MTPSTPAAAGKGTAAPAVAGTTWYITLPLAKPLSLNSRQHWHAKARDVAALRDATRLLVRNAHIGYHERVTVGLVYYPPDQRRRDADNLVATLKPACDALVDEGVVIDDDPAHMVKLMPVIGPVVVRPQMVLTVTAPA